MSSIDYKWLESCMNSRAEECARIKALSREAQIAIVKKVAADLSTHAKTVSMDHADGSAVDVNGPFFSESTSRYVIAVSFEGRELKTELMASRNRNVITIRVPPHDGVGIDLNEISLSNSKAEHSIAELSTKIILALKEAAESYRPWS